jgi:hypothetical protein
MAGHEYYRDLETVLSHEEGPIRITDLAFMARWELKAQVASLRELATETRLWTIVAECGAARRKLTKSLTAVEIAIAAFEGGESLLEPHYRTERQRALETRRAYARLRQELRRLPEFDDTTGIANLRVAGIAIAVLVGQEIYDDLRISDRIQLRGIQQRILEHLREDIERRGNTRSNDAAQRTFQDLVTCTDLFLQVNQRTELVEHDKALIDAAVRELERLGPDGAVSEEWIARARGLVGRDAVIDELLRTESSDGDAWRAALECARAGLTAV